MKKKKIDKFVEGEVESVLGFEECIEWSDKLWKKLDTLLSCLVGFEGSFGRVDETVLGAIDPGSSEFEINEFKSKWDEKTKALLTALSLIKFQLKEVQLFSSIYRDLSWNRHYKDLFIIEQYLASIESKKKGFGDVELDDVWGQLDGVVSRVGDVKSMNELKDYCEIRFGMFFTSVRFGLLDIETLTRSLLDVLLDEVDEGEFRSLFESLFVPLFKKIGDFRDRL